MNAVDLDNDGDMDVVVHSVSGEESGSFGSGHVAAVYGGYVGSQIAVHWQISCGAGGRAGDAPVARDESHS